MARAARREAARAGKMAPLLSRRPVTYRCAFYGASPVVASFTANAPTIRTTNPMTTKAVNGLISATIALRGSANRARSGLCRRRPFAEPWPKRPAAKRQERRKWRSAKRARSGLCRRRPFAEPWPERPAAKRQERKNGSTSVETTGHLSVRALGVIGDPPAVRRRTSQIPGWG